MGTNEAFTSTTNTPAFVIAVLPNVTYTAEAHRHQLRDDIIVGGKKVYDRGTIAVSDGAGLGVTLDRDKLGEYAERCRCLGNHPHDPDPARPGWVPLVPITRWAVPNDSVRPEHANLAG